MVKSYRQTDTVYEISVSGVIPFKQKKYFETRTVRTEFETDCQKKNGRPSVRTDGQTKSIKDRSSMSYRSNKKKLKSDG